MGEVCDESEVAPKDKVVVKNFAFTPPNLLIPSGTSKINSIAINNGGGPRDAIPAGTQKTGTITGGMGAGLAVESPVRTRQLRRFRAGPGQSVLTYLLHLSPALS